MTEPALLPPVFFNHLYVVLDDKTYRAIQASDFLSAAFPGVERRGTLTAAGETWYGTYYYCLDNYLEFFGESTGRHWQTGAQEGWAGIAFSTDQPGGVAQVSQALQKAYHYKPYSELRKVRVAEEKTIRWFYQVKLSEQLGLESFDSWVMEYHPDIFAHKDIALPENGLLTRQAYLSPWNRRHWSDLPSVSVESGANQGHPSPDGDVHKPELKDLKVQTDADKTAFPPRAPVFSRVVGATIHMDADRAERYAEILTLLGYIPSRIEHQINLSAHGFTLQIRPEENAPAGYRLSSLRLQMARPSVAPMTFVFAQGARLVLKNDQTAEWFFGRSRLEME